MRTRSDSLRALGAFLVSVVLVVSGPVARSQPPPPAEPLPWQPPALQPASPAPSASAPSASAPSASAPSAPVSPPPLAPVAPQGSALPPSPAPLLPPPGAPPCNPLSFPPIYAPYLAPGYRGFSLSLLPSVLPYEEGQPIPLGYELKSRATRRFLIMGAVAFSATYLPSAIAGGAVASAADHVGWGEPMLIPLAGPFIAIGAAHTQGLFTLALVLDGLVQTAGAAIFITGLVIDEPILTRIKNKSFGLPAPALLVGPGSAALRWRF